MGGVRFPAHRQAREFLPYSQRRWSTRVHPNTVRISIFRVRTKEASGIGHQPSRTMLNRHLQNTLEAKVTSL